MRGLGFDADEVDTLVAEVRRRDADRLTLQRSGDLAAGLPVQPTPEPLSEPVRRGDARRRDGQPAAAPQPVDDDLARPAAE